MSRLPYALLGALALHGLLLLVRAHHASVPLTAPSSELSEQVVDLEQPVADEPAPENTPTAERAVGSLAEPASVARAGSRTAAPTPSRAGVGAEVASNADAPESPSAGDAPNGLGAPEAAASADAHPRKIDFGLDGQFFMRPPSEDLPRVHKSELQRQLEASISADDVKHGLARGNVLLGSLNSAIRDTGPVRGDALLRVTVGADGSVTDVEFLQGAASNWATALKAFRELATRKRVRVPSGARGLRVTFSVRAKVQLPSGKEVKGVDVDGPSLAPNGMTLHGTFDVADIGAQAQRLVYARVVSEEVL